MPDSHYNVGKPEDSVAHSAAINDRNHIRAANGLPLLSVAEQARLITAREQTEFEREWQRRRSEFADRWQNNGTGWLTNSARWASARQQVRREMMKKPPIENT